MRAHFRRLALAVAGASVLAGAVLSVLPALVIGLVALFYNSAGGILILLGSLLSLLPHPPAAAAQGASSLPAFPVLQSGSLVVVSWSVAGTLLCAITFALLVTPQGRQPRVVWLAIIACASLAAFAGGPVVGMLLAPAMAFSIGQLAVRMRHRA